MDFPRNFTPEQEVEFLAYCNTRLYNGNQVNWDYVDGLVDICLDCRETAKDVAQTVMHYLTGDLSRNVCQDFISSYMSDDDAEDVMVSADEFKACGDTEYDPDTIPLTCDGHTHIYQDMEGVARMSHDTNGNFAEANFNTLEAFDDHFIQEMLDEFRI